MLYCTWVRRAYSVTNEQINIFIYTDSKKKDQQYILYSFLINQPVHDTEYQTVLG